MNRGEKNIRVQKIDIAELKAILERTRASLTEDDHGKLSAVVGTLASLTMEIQAKNASIRRLRDMLFGVSTEKTSNVLGDKPAVDGEDAQAAGSSTSLSEPALGHPCPADSGEMEGKQKEKRKGHGRNGSTAYTGAKKIKVTHATLKHGDGCPTCDRGKVYVQAEGTVIVRVVGMAPIDAEVYTCESLRCNGCGEVFKAQPPAGVGTKKYDESVAAMIALFKYGCGVPFHRLEKLQASFGIPLPAATQWELVDEAVETVEPAFTELMRQAAQAEVVHNDDTTMKILQMNRAPPDRAESAEGRRERTGTFTSGIIARAEHGRDLALFFTGRNHAGENLATVLKHREEELSAPIQMCDALSRNTKGEFKTILANCLAHGRRRFVEVAENFPNECRYVLETLGDVYGNDDVAKDRGLSPEERLRFHHDQSGPLMQGLAAWLREQIDERKVEPNSTLGEAIEYMRNHWQALTLFLREAGAPLDNNICERALKKAILHRKNSLFFKTDHGARVGDIFMSLIHTAELNHENPFDYLVALQRHANRVMQNPADWMPWNYRQTTAALPQTESPRPPQP